MRGALVRVGIDQAFGHWNAPVDPRTGEFVYVLIPDGAQRPGLETWYRDLTPALTRFPGIQLPAALATKATHLDPDFSHLTYGDNGIRRGKGLADFEDRDVVVFFAGLRPVDAWRDPLLYEPRVRTSSDKHLWYPLTMDDAQIGLGANRLVLFRAVARTDATDWNGAEARDVARALLRCAELAADGPSRRMIRSDQGVFQLGEDGPYAFDCGGAIGVRAVTPEGGPHSLTASEAREFAAALQALANEYDVT